MAGEAGLAVRAALAPYLEIMRAYLRGQLADTDFETEFNPRYLTDGFMWPDDMFDQLDAVFAVAEEFEADPALRAEQVDATDQEEMHRIISTAYAKLTEMLETQ